MHIPHGWTTAPAGGYGNFTHLTHDRCGHHTDVDLVLDERKARQIITSHECDDLREEREAREAQQARDKTAHDNTNRELAALRAKVEELAGKLTGIATPAPVRLLVLDATTRDTLNASVDKLTRDDFLALAAAVDTAHNRQMERDTLDLIRDTLIGATPDGLTVAGVLFTAEQYTSDYYFSSHATVLFSDGSTTTLEFEDAEEALRELYENVDPDTTLAIDLRTDTFDFAYRKRSRTTIHERFDIPPSRDERILAILHATFASGEDEHGEPIMGEVIGVQFKPRQEEDGYYLNSNVGRAIYDDASTDLISFPGIAAVFAETIGRVGERFTLSVDMRTNTVTTVDNDLLTMEIRFRVPDIN